MMGPRTTGEPGMTGPPMMGEPRMTARATMTAQGLVTTGRGGPMENQPMMDRETTTGVGRRTMGSTVDDGAVDDGGDGSTTADGSDDGDGDGGTTADGSDDGRWRWRHD